MIINVGTFLARCEASCEHTGQLHVTLHDCKPAAATPRMTFANVADAVVQVLLKSMSRVYHGLTPLVRASVYVDLTKRHAWQPMQIVEHQCSSLALGDMPAIMTSLTNTTVAQSWLPPSFAKDLTLDQFVTRIEDNPIEQHGGKRGALTEAEKMLLIQQDELRQLRNRQAAEQARQALPGGRKPMAAEQDGGKERSAGPALPGLPVPFGRNAGEQASTQASDAPPAAPPSPAQSAQARQPDAARVVPEPQQPVAAAPAPESSAKEEGGGGFGALGNVVGIAAAGVLGGFLYQSRKRTEEVEAVYTQQLAGKDEVCRQRAWLWSDIALHLLTKKQIALRSANSI